VKKFKNENKDSLLFEEMRSGSVQEVYANPANTWRTSGVKIDVAKVQDVKYGERYPQWWPESHRGDKIEQNVQTKPTNESNN